jgi:hypothetical protein
VGDMSVTFWALAAVLAATLVAVVLLELLA